MARYFDVHPDNPQPRAIAAVVDLLGQDGLIAYPTDSCFALGCQLDNRAGTGADHGRSASWTINTISPWSAATSPSSASWSSSTTPCSARSRRPRPGQYTFILPATREVPRRMLHPKKRTVGVRIPDHPVAQALLAELGEPMVSSTLLMPGEEVPMTQGWEIKERLDHLVDAVIDSGECGEVPTTVVDFSSGRPVVVRYGAGDPARFE